MTLRRVLISLLAFATFGVLECGGDKPSEPQIQKPDITQFTATPTDILAGDSTLATYTAVRADSLVLIPTGTKLGNANSGSLYLKPPIPTRYTLHAYNTAGRDSSSILITMSSHSPLLSFALSEDTIVIGDSTELLFSAFREDSIVIAGIGKVTPADSGSRYIKPTATTSYTAIAYGPYGSDTETVVLRVEVPYQIQAANGIYFKGTMGSSVVSPSMRFRVVDFNAQMLRKVWTHFSVIDGDGAVSPDSVRAGEDGFVQATYSFSGSRADAMVRIAVPGVDSIDLFVRANLLVPGAIAQAQYILLSDSYQTIKGFNGTPVAIDPVPGKYLRVANYEASLGFVAVIDDANHNDIADDGEVVNTLVKVFGDERTGLIINTVSKDTSAEGIGIGSSISNIRTAYGSPDSAYIYSILDTLVAFYSSRGLTFFCGMNTPTGGDTIVAEIHLWKP